MLCGSPIQSKWVPPNCRFEIDDAEDDWTYRPDDYFDFIHARNVSLGITDWPRLLSQAYRYVKFASQLPLSPPHRLYLGNGNQLTCRSV
jgi:hypothetical protein